MIIEQLPNSIPFFVGEGLATKLQGEALPEIVEVPTNDICYCKYECEYVEKVFADVGGEWYKNDKNSFLFKKLLSTDSITLKLYKAGIEIATLNNNTYGTYYASFTAQPFYVGFVIEWEKVFNVSGFGRYQVKAEISIVGTPSTYESQKFLLAPYTDISANRTVRIECHQTGNIIGSEFDYTDLLPSGWYQSYRIAGHFGLKEASIEVDNYLNQDYKLKQIQDKISHNYTLETELLPSNISNALVDDNLLSNRFYVTDYNFLNTELFRRVELYPVEISEMLNPNFSTKTKIIIKFTDKIDNLIKNNF